MKSEGLLAPETPADVRDRFESLEPTAKTVLRAVGRQLSMDTKTYREEMDDDLRLTAQEAMFASLLVVRVGTREEYERWRAETDTDVVEEGSENVDNVVWHSPSFGDTAVAATFQNEREAAVGTLRRQAFARIYRDIVAESGGESKQDDGTDGGREESAEGQR